jgi:hypothetical protein
MSRSIDWTRVYTGYEARALYERLCAATNGANLAPLGPRDTRRLREMIERLGRFIDQLAEVGR